MTTVSSNDTHRSFGLSERGAAMVEFAIIVPLLVMLVFGALEFGLAFKDRLSFNHAVAGAARIGSVMGTDDGADYAILGAVEAGLVGAVQPETIDKVVIYKANANGTMSTSQNHYTYNPATACKWDPCPDPDNFVGYGAPGNWPPSARNTQLVPQPDVIGVQVQYTHEWVTNVLPFMSSPANWADDARMRLEPDVYGTTS
jgi:Flp pilus assembly pilin Flp